MKKNNQLKLKDWNNVKKVGTRFPPSIFDCPECKKKALNDNWPPNYGGGSGYYSSTGLTGESNFSQKCVCINCKIAFRVSVTEKYRDGKCIFKNTVYSETIPLVEKDGFFLTPHDVWREKYKEEHGEYPEISFA